jgi:hypothetical protein
VWIEKKPAFILADSMNGKYEAGKGVVVDDGHCYKESDDTNTVYRL